MCERDVRVVLSAVRGRRESCQGGLTPPQGPGLLSKRLRNQRSSTPRRPPVGLAAGTPPRAATRPHGGAPRPAHRRRTPPVRRTLRSPHAASAPRHPCRADDRTCEFAPARTPVPI